MEQRINSMRCCRGQLLSNCEGAITLSRKREPLGRSNAKFTALVTCVPIITGAVGYAPTNLHKSLKVLGFTKKEQTKD